MKAISTALVFALALSGHAAPPKDQAPSKRFAEHYKLDNITMPPGVNAQIGGMTTLADGRIAVAFHHGQVAIYTPKTKDWKVFAEGLHEPLGILAEPDGALLVMQRPELTRLRDTNGDGVADEYTALWEDFGMSGNYHEFAFGPARGPNGKLYVGLNVASNGGSIRPEIRGEWSPIGVSRNEIDTDWKSASRKIGRMYSRVAWRGWIMEIDPQTGQGTPFASGFRSPDGIAFDAQGNLLVSDNQGDWRGSSELYVVKAGGFHGHPASLVWRKDWDGSEPLKVPVPKLEQMRTKAAVWFPHNIYANSPTAEVIIPKTPAWGAFGGQILIGEMNSPRILRVLLEQTDGVWQGACVNLTDEKSIKAGVHRLAFSGDTLYLGHTHLSWAGGEGINTITPTGKLPFDPLDIHVTPTGFRLDFTEPLNDAASNPQLWAITHYSYSYHAVYGSPQRDLGTDKPTKVTLSNDGKTAEITLEAMREDFVYDFNLSALSSKSGVAPLNTHLAYTLRKIPKK